MLSSGVPFPVPAVSPVPSAGDLECLHARELARATAAEASVAELEDKLRGSEACAREWKRESIEARSELNGLRTTFGSNRWKLAAARADLKDLRRSRSVRNMHRLEREMARLQGLLKAVGIRWRACAGRLAG